ncbi:MAG TPA: PBP1A family penicillin-binding protein [Vicinamibacterales bacterium]|nr:PBP1A family penicillin-binding protein [Vicinamibacterales bacterium]
MARVVVRIARSAGIAALFLIAALLGIASGVVFAYTGDLPKISDLDDYAPSTITRLYGTRGEIIGEFAIQRREVIPYDAISPMLRQAILAAEDDEFEQHVGLSIPRIIVTLIKDIIKRKKAGGASTLTQQLARKLFLTDEKTWERKIREALLTIQIEKRYTKREIFTLYCNQMYFGHGVYGVEAASRLYFGKSAKDLQLEEAAMIAGILQGNVRQSPYVNMEAALRRRNYTLGRMAEVAFITQAQADEARQKPIVTRGEPGGPQSVAAYFVEEVRKELEQRYGAKQLYENGLSVQTGLDTRLQDAVNRALDDGLRRIDKVRGWRKPRRNVVAEGHTVEAFRHARWDRPMRVGHVVPAVVTAADGTTIHARAGLLSATIDRKGYGWTRKTVGTQLVSLGDLIEVRLAAVDEATKAATGSLEQPPVVEGAILALDNRTGQVRAMTGGFSFERSKFNRATQAFRQVGSSFKPIVYTAAIDRGYTPASVVMDSPASFSGGSGQPAYSPMNYDRRFEGAITLRRALEQSRNVPAVRMMEQLGPRQVIMFARRLGLESPLPPYLPIALGAAEATLVEMTNAYAVFPNQGVRMKPYSVLKVTDREGNVLEENRPEPKDAIRADTAFVMTNLLRGVVQRGTAAKAAELSWPVGGKTGTTDDYTDAWFIGFDPDITVGVWVGLDQKKPIGHNQTGTAAALPIWIDVMKAWIGDRKDPPKFDPPGNIVFLSVDKGTGGAAADGTPGAISEAFIVGTQPGSIKQ